MLAPEPVAPPRLPHLAVGALLLCSILALLGADVLQGVYPPYGLMTMAAGITALGLVGVAYLRYRWRWYWWRRGVQELWPGWIAPFSPGRPAYRYPTDDRYLMDDEVVNPYPTVQEELAA